MKFCTDCKWAKFHGSCSFGGSWFCHHPKLLNPVDGEGAYAADARLKDSECGPDGNLWEAKPPPPPLWQHWFWRWFVPAPRLKSR